MSLLPVIDVPDDPGDSVIAFLRRLARPCCIRIPGADSSRCRFAVTLLHGNEPSGLYAIYELLQSGCRPVCDIYLAVMNIPTALAEPLFSFRYLPGRRDLNRCFREPFDDDDGRLAKALIDLIHDKRPEALVDIHNTSGAGPAFGVAVDLDSKHDALVSLFTERLIITDLRLGALMELSEQDVPTVTVECGGSDSTESHRIAADGLRRYFTIDDLFDLREAPWPIEILHNPVRLELSPELVFSYGEQPNPATELTLRADIEHYNFGVVDTATVLGWGDPGVVDKLTLRNAARCEPVTGWFEIVDGELRPARALRLFMITARADIARSDCLLYAVRSGGQSGTT